MVLLRRTVRLCINSPGKAHPDPQAASQPGPNTFAASPPMRGLGRYYELEVACRGEVDKATGYFLNIKVIDQAVRKHAIPIIERACREDASADPHSALGEICREINSALSGVIASVRWRLTPYYSIEMSLERPEHVLIRQQFDFAAAHRLFVPGLTDEENRRLFGKCTNPSGHGHNYRIEPCVQVPLNGGTRFSLDDLERLTIEAVIDRFDHTHLNIDRAEFSPGKGLNPSVENIAKVCYDLLAPTIAGHPGGARLTSVTVWETDKTSCTFPG